MGSSLCPEREAPSAVCARRSRLGSRRQPLCEQAELGGGGGGDLAG